MTNRINKSILFSIIAVIAIICISLMPSLKIIQSFAIPVTSDINRLLTGMSLFKVGLIINGFVLFLLFYKSSRSTNVNNPLYNNPSGIYKDINSKPRFKSSIALVLLLVIAALLRLRGINSDLWYDEVLTLVEFVRLPFGQLLTSYIDQNNHVFYSLLSNISVSVFGESPGALRLPALLFGLASIWVLYNLARNLTDDREAWLATILITLSYHHVWFSQNARGYTGLLFCTLSGTCLFIKVLRKASTVSCIIYAAFMALGIYTHLTSVFLLVSHIIIYCFILLKHTNFLKNVTSSDWWPVKSFILVGLFTFQLYSLILPQVINSFQGRLGEGALRVEAWTNPIWGLFEAVKGLSISFGTILGGVIALLLFGAGLISYARSNQIVIWLLLIPLLIGTITLIIAHLHFYPRFFFFLLGIGFLVLVRGTTESARLFQLLLPKKLSSYFSVRKAGTLFASIIIVASFITLANNYRYPKQDYSGALAYIKENCKDSDLVVSVGMAMYPFEKYYAPEWETIKTLDALNEILSDNKTIWLVYIFQDHMESLYPEIMSSINQDFTVAKKFPGTLNGGSVYVCVNDKSQRLNTYF
ncbi:glycosyltransferase family 39 protein [Candidatus Scalindua japonica]|nr:glycosyltransferase family 39 protein [Candidatus Scalindua japonica]